MKSCRWGIGPAVLIALMGTASAQTVPVPIQNADVNDDGVVAMADVSIVQSNLGRRCGQPALVARADVNRDCVVNVTDVAFVSRNLGARFPPTIVATVTPPANSAGWHKGDAAVSFMCTGVTSCPAPVTVTTEGAGQPVDRTVSNAGGSATAHVILNIDRTSPALSFAMAPPSSIVPGGTGVISIDAADNIGIASVTLSVDGVVAESRESGPFTFAFSVPVDTEPGTSRGLSIEARDLAGNSTALSRSVLVQASQLSLSVVPPLSPAFEPSAVIAGAVDGALGGTTVTVTGGAAAASQRLAPNQAQFEPRVPLKPNADNSLTVTATDDAGQTASARNISVLQLTLSSIVTAQVTVRRLSTLEVKALAANGTINVSDPSNFNVSMFTVALTVAGRPVTVTVPVVKAIGQSLGLGPQISIECNEPGRDIEETANAILVPCSEGTGDGLGKLGRIKLRLFEIDIPDAPVGTPSIPGVILIDGRIKTLKEFFKVDLLLMNVSSAFTLEGITARLTVPDHGLSPVAPASALVTLGDLGPGTQGTGQFVIRGDDIGIHTVTVDFGARISGPPLSAPIPVSGSASTDVEVKGPPTLGVTVEHPPSVTAEVPYTLKVNIKNTSPDLDALFTSLELNLGGADLIEPTSGVPRAGSAISSLGDILTGQTVSRSYTVVPHRSGPITSCVAGATANITLSVVFPDSSLGCSVGTVPSQMATPSGRPTVTVLPAPNTTNVPVDATITAFFSAAIQQPTVTTGLPGATFQLSDAANASVSGQLQFVTLANGATAAVFRPGAPLRPDTTYTIGIDANIFDVDGAQLASGVVAHFTTQPAATTDATPPDVTLRILPPASPLAVPKGQILCVLVDPTDSSGVVARLDLLLDDLLVDARVPHAPVTFLVDTSDLDPGSTHVLTAVATDAAGNRTSTAINIAITSDTTPPLVAMSALGTVTRGQTLPVSIQATDNARVARVDVFLDGGSTPVHVGLLAPYHFGLDAGFLANGPHQLRAQAIDGAGNVAQATLGFSVRSLLNVTLSPPAIALAGTGATQTIAVMQTFSDGTTAPLPSAPTFSSSNEDVATVSASGVVTSVRPGAATITASVGSLASSQAPVTVVATAPAALSQVGGDNQTGTVGQPLLSPFVVRVSDATGLPVPDLAVTFSVLAGAGTPAVHQATTNIAGQASMTLTLGQDGGENRVTVAAAGLAASPVTFRAVGKAPNRPPTLANPGNQNSVESAIAALTLTANDPDGDPLTFAAAGLPPSLSIDGTGRIAGTVGATAGTYPVTVTVSDGNASTSQTFTWTVTEPLTPFVDLGVTITDSPDPIAAGPSLTYTVVVSNLGSAPATNVIANDALPPGVIFVSASPLCAPVSGTVTCNLGTIASKQTTTVTIVVAGSIGGSVTNSVTVSGSQIDTAPANNAATTVTTVVIPPFGGSGLSPATTTELFHASGLNWTPTGSMVAPRAGATLTVLADGTVLALGGLGQSATGSSVVSSGELFNPATGVWSPAVPLTAPRAFHTATLLSNGDVLITGGVNASGSSVATAEIYRGPPVQKVTPVVTWLPPAAIASGTPLGSVQLNATATVPGTFIYSPPAGTTFSVGLHTLSVTFVPQDTIHFTMAVVTSALAVNPR